MLVPIAIGIVAGLIILGNVTVANTADAQSDAELTFTYSDASGYVDPDVAASLGGTAVTDDSAAIAAVKAEDQDAHFVYPVVSALNRPFYPSQVSAPSADNPYGLFAASHTQAVSLKGLLKARTTSSAPARCASPSKFPLIEGQERFAHDACRRSTCLLRFPK